MMGGFGGMKKAEIPPSIEMWRREVENAVASRQGVRIASMLNPSKSPFFFDASTLQNMKTEELEAAASRLGKCIPFASESFKQVVSSYLHISQAVVAGGAEKLINWPAVVKYGVIFLNQWIDIYRSPEARPFAWMVPCLESTCSFLTQAGYEADKKLESDPMAASSEYPSGVVEPKSDAVDSSELSDLLLQNDSQQTVLNTIRQHIGKFRSDKYRQAAYIILMCESIRGCLLLRNMQMASSFLKAIESSPVTSVNSLPRGPTVTFRYFLGKLYMQQEVFTKAEQVLLWAFSNCRTSNVDMKRNILECLVAVRLRMEISPPLSLLQKYNLVHYIELVRAIKQGSIKKFDRTLRKYEAQFLQEGTLLCLERVKFSVYRQLVYRTRNWWLEALSSATNIIPIPLFTAAFKWQCDDEFLEFNDEEMACIIANLIKLGYIKGYIAWEHMKVVFSKQNPFPKVFLVS